jgi:nucleotide-binding universal stress UspA family protein
VDIVTDPPDFAILKHIEKYGVDLVVMGPSARSGIPGIITGITAEVLLPQLHCSVIAVKPAGFVCPISA